MLGRVIRSRFTRLLVTESFIIATMTEEEAGGAAHTRMMTRVVTSMIQKSFGMFLTTHDH